MEKLFKNSKRWMTTFGVVAFLMVAGWQVGADGTKEVFTETKEIFEIEVARSGMGGSKRCVYDSDTGGTNIYCKKTGSLCNYTSQCIPPGGG